MFFKENVLISVSLGSWKIYSFQQKMNKLFSEQKQMANCNRFAQKKWKCKASENYENAFCWNKNNKRERGGREGRRARTAKRENGAKEQGRTLYTPHLPIARPQRKVCYIIYCMLYIIYYILYIAYYIFLYYILCIIYNIDYIIYYISYIIYYI